MLQVSISRCNRLKPWGVRQAGILLVSHIIQAEQHASKCTWTEGENLMLVEDRLRSDFESALLAAVLLGKGDGEFAGPGQDEGDDVGEARVLMDPEALVVQGAERLFYLAFHVLLAVIHVDARIGVPFHNLLLTLRDTCASQ